MTNQYNEAEKIWSAPSFQLTYQNIGLGHSILEKLKETDPNRVIEVEHESGASLTAGQLRSQTITVAQNLIRLGVKMGDIVIVYSRSSIKITPITFALYTIGAPINFFFLDLKGADIEYYFELFNPTAILYEEEFKKDIFQALKNIDLSNLKHTISLDSETESVDEILFKPIDNIDNFQPPDIGDPSKLAALLPFTSGSTGRPKISTYSHSMLLLGVYNKWWQEMDPKSVVCVLSDLRWACQMQIMLQPIFFDVKRVYTSKYEKDYDDSYEYELLFKNKVTHFFTVPILHVQTLKNAEMANQTSKLKHLRSLLLCGEVVSDPLIKYAKQIVPNCKIINAYGMTELYGLVASDEKVIDRTVNGGILRNGYMLKIIDEQGNQLGPNEKGRLCLKSVFRLIGFFKNEAANKEHLREDRWFTTADYGYMDSEHLLNVVTRFNYLLRYNGQFIVPTDIENIVSNHPNVLTAALVGYKDPENKDSDIGTFFVALKDNSQRNGIENELLTLLRENLTKYQSKFVRFFKVLEYVPMLNYCKVNRTALKEMAAIESVNYLQIKN